MTEPTLSVRDNRDQDLLVLSFFNETRILAFGSSNAEVDQDEEAEEEVNESEEIEEIELPAFASTQATLHACNIGSIVLQITSAGISYCDSSMEGAEVKLWKHEEGKKITLATSDDKWIVLAVEGGNVVLLEAIDDTIVAVT